MKHVVLLVVRCSTKFQETWPGKGLGGMHLCLFCFCTGRMFQWGAGIYPLTVLYINVYT